MEENNISVSLTAFVAENKDMTERMLTVLKSHYPVSQKQSDCLKG